MGLAILADGMGGYNAGEAASGITAEVQGWLPIIRFRDTVMEKFNMSPDNAAPEVTV